VQLDTKKRGKKGAEPVIGWVAHVKYRKSVGKGKGVRRRKTDKGALKKEKRGKNGRGSF